MFKAVLVARYLRNMPGKPLLGLKAELEALASEGIQTSQADVDELMEWARFRNLLSHSPPEHFHPVAVDREDVEEYMALLKRVCASWDAQRPKVPNAV